MILSVNHISKSFLDETVIKDASFHIEEHEKAALVGMNGAGKTTLFRIITGALPADSGEVTLKKDASMGYLEQHTELYSEVSVFEEVLSVRKAVFEMEEQMRALEHQMAEAEGDMLEPLMKRHANLLEEFEKQNGYAVKSEVTGVLKGLGFSEQEFDLQVSSLSGGEKTRIALCKLLLIRPDILLLDEPTNHLDIHAVTWLEGFLLNYPGAVFVISHDRYFMDRLVTKVVDLSLGTTAVYNGNYSEYTVKKQAVFEARIKEYEKQQAEIKHQEEVIEKLRSFNREKSIKRAESRVKMLDKIDRIEKPFEENDAMKLRLTPNVLSGNDVLTIRGLSKGFDQKDLFLNADLEIKRGEHVVLIGDNGTGKSTLLKMITGQILPDSGSVTYGTNVYIGYYDQEHQVLDDTKTIFNEISDAYPKMNNTQIRNVLAAFLFTGDDVYKLIGELSGGEKGRVSLAKLMLSDSNLLILDEPTNHLDMTSKEILENAVNSYEGTLLAVSHDRYFINRTASRIIELWNGHFLNYIGNYDYYLEKRDAFHEAAAAVLQEDTVPAESAGLQDWKKQKEEQARKRKAENDLAKVEADIAALEEKIAVLDDEMAAPENATNSAKLNEIAVEQSELREKLDLLYERWEEMMS